MNKDIEIKLTDENVDIKIDQITANVRTERKTVSPTEETQVVEPTNGKYFDQITIDPIVATSKTVKSSKNGIVTIEPDEGEYFNEIIVNKFELENKTITPSIQEQVITPTKDGFDTITVRAAGEYLDSDIKPENIRANVKIFNTVGTMGANSEIKYANAKTTQVTVEPSQGVEFLKKVYINPVTSSIDDNIKPQNIKRGKTILGTTGTYDGDNTYQTKTVNPSTQTQTIKPDAGTNFLDKVIVNAVTSEIDNNIVPNKIKIGETILGVEGTYNGDIQAQEKTVNPTTYSQDITPDDNFDYLTKVKVNAVTKNIDPNITSSNIKRGISILGVNGTVDELVGQQKIVTPRTTEQTIKPDAGYTALTNVTVGAVTHEIDENIKSNNIKKDTTILGVVGTYEGSTNLQEKTANPSSTIQEITADTDYDGLSKVTINAVETETKEVIPSKYAQTINPTSGKFINRIEVSAVDSSVDANLQPENIKENISILGVTGTYSGGSSQEYFGALTSGSTGVAGILKAILKLPTLAISGTSLDYAFYNCYYLQEMPNIDYSNVTSMNYAFYCCYKLPSVTINSTKANKFSYAFQDCSVLENVYININGSSGTTFMNYMFKNCTKLKHVEFNTGSEKLIVSGSYLSNAFANCSSYNTILDLRNITTTNLNSAQIFNSFGTTDAEIKMSLITGNSYLNQGNNLFTNCKAKLSFESDSKLPYSSPLYNYKGTTVSSVQMGHWNNSNYYIVYSGDYNSTLVNFGGFIDVGRDFPTSSAENAYKYYLYRWTALSHDSLVNCINGLYDLTSIGVNPQALYLTSNQIAMLSPEELAIATNKGWNILS